MLNYLFRYIYKLKKIIQLNKKICYIALAVIIAIITILVIKSAFKGAKFGNTSGNSNNHGIATQNNNWIYYIGIDDDEPAGIFRTKTNGKKSEKVIEGAFYNLNVIDNYIYCMEEDDSNYQANLIKVKTNGKNKETLAKDIDENSAIIAVDNWIYYTKNSSLYRINTKGTDREKISSKDISYYQISGKWIYYIYKTDDSEYIAKMKLNGEDAQKIFKANDENLKALYVKNNKVFYIAYETNDSYIDEYSLYKINTDGRSASKICKIDNNIEMINMQDDGIYYTVSNNFDDYEIKYIKYNGTGKTTIKKIEEIQSLNIADKWLILLTEDEDNELVIEMISKNGNKKIIL